MVKTPVGSGFSRTLIRLGLIWVRLKPDPTVVVLILCLLLQARIPAQAPPPAPAVVAGVVVNATSGEPLGGVTVQLHLNGIGPGGRAYMPTPPVCSQGRCAQPGPRTYTVTTSPDGRFAIDGATPGEYRLLAIRTGFVAGEYGQRTPGGFGVPLVLAAGDKRADIRLMMSPGGSISGRVFDRSGEPVGRASVQALKPIYRSGRRALTIAAAVETNDRGEYRLFHLPPGRYYVSAIAVSSIPEVVGPMAGMLRTALAGTYDISTAPTVRSRMLRSGEVVEEIFVPVYYPGTLDTQTASPLQLAPAANISGVDVPVSSGVLRSWRIRGVVINTTTGQPVGGATVMARPQLASPNELVPSGTSNPNGTFDIAGVTPGAYTLLVRNARLSGSAFTQVGQNDVQNVIVPIGPGVTLSGRFVIEGRPRTGSAPSMEDLRVNLEHDETGSPSLGRGASFLPPPSPDGAFVVEGVDLGDYRVTVRALPPDSYIKSVRMGNADILDGGLHLYGPPGNTRLDVVVGADAGAVAGTVVNARQEPLVNRTVALVPERALRHRRDLYKSVETDAAGRFHFRGVAPGDYQLMAWDTIEPGAWQDPEFIRAYDDRGRSIRIHEGSDENVQVTVIP